MSRPGASSSSSIGIGNPTTSSLRDRARLGTLKDELKASTETSKRSGAARRQNSNTNTAQYPAPCNNAKELHNVSTEKDTASSRRQLPPLPVRRTSLEMKSQDGKQPITGRQSTHQRTRNHDQRECKAGTAVSGTISANSSPRLHRCGPVQSSGNLTYR